LAISATNLPDLSDLVPIGNSAQNFVVLNWATLLRDHPRSLVAGSSLFVGSQVQAIGYMVEADRPIGEGQWLQDFVLLPEAGHFLHPAHRFGDQMITVHLEPDTRVRYSSRALVWVYGTFRAFAGDPVGSKPLYALDRARVQAAERAEILKYFK
jgi:hypothetical protein